MRRRVAISSVAAGALALALVVAATYLAVANWQLQNWLRARSAELGCSLDYVSAGAGMPGHFHVDQARLSQCTHGWGARVVQAEAQVRLRSMLWGPVQLERVELRLDSLRVGGVTLDGTLQVVIENRLGAANLQVVADQLSLRQDGRELASSGRTRLDAEIGAGATPQGTAEFVLKSFASPPLALAAKQPLTGSLQMTFDTRVPQLDFRQASLREAPLRLEDDSVQAMVELHDASFSPSGSSASGRLRLQGEDAHLLLDQLRAPEALSFALSGLKDAPFTLSSSVSYVAGKWKFDQIELRTDEASVSGAVSLHEADRAGTLRVTYRGLPLGVQFSNEQSNVFLDPPADWPRSGT